MVNKGRKTTGGKYHKQSKKKKHTGTGHVRVVKVGKTKTKTIRERGGNLKTVSLSQEFVNVIKNGKSKKVKVVKVLETPSNRFLARQNVLVKSAIIETDLGKVRVTNRPSQEGNAQGILIE